MRIGRAATLWLVGGLAAACCALIVVRLPGMVAQASWNADSLIPWVMAESGTAASDRVGGQYAFPSVLWFDELTQWVPGHRVLWTLAPLAVWALVVVAVALPVARLAGRAAGALAAAILVCACAPVMQTFLYTDFHTTTFLAGAVIGAWLAALVVDPRLRRPAPSIAGAVVIGAFAGTQLVDPLLWLAGIAPLAAAAVAWRLVERTPDVSRALCSLALLIVVAAAAEVVTQAIMRATHFRTEPTDVHIVLDPDHVRDQVSLLAQMVWHMGDGALELSVRGPLRGTLALLAAAAMTLVAITPVLLALRCVISMVRRRPRDALETTWTVFWGTATVLLAAAVLFTTAATNLDSFRYIVGILLAGAATVPLLVRWAAPVRALALAAVAVYLVSALVGLADRSLSRWHGASEQALASLQAFAQENGVRHGYGDYWYAAPITWHTDGRLTVRPVASCSATTSAICRSPVGADAAWYQPQPGRSMLVVPTRWPLPQGLPEPVKQAVIGPLVGSETATAYVFDRDIVGAIGPPPAW